MFLNKIRNIFCVPDTIFVSATNVARGGKRGNICVGNNVSATILSSFATGFMTLTSASENISASNLSSRLCGPLGPQKIRLKRNRTDQNVLALLFLSFRASECVYIFPCLHVPVTVIPARVSVRALNFVYVIGLHAVQFGNNWMKKIPRTAKIGRGRRPSPIWLSEEFFESNYFQIGQACSPLTY